jgi:hypothetical protein
MKLNALPPSSITNFNNYLEENVTNAQTSKINDSYYHVNIVAEAYSKGFTDGEQQGQKAFIDNLKAKNKERFLEKATAVYLFSKTLVRELKEKSFNVEKIYINPFDMNPKVILAVKDNLLIEDHFINTAYSRIYEMQCAFLQSFKSTLDLSLIGKDDLNESLLSADGFKYSETID